MPACIGRHLHRFVVPYSFVYSKLGGGGGERSLVRARCHSLSNRAACMSACYRDYYIIHTMLAGFGEDFSQDMASQKYGRHGVLTPRLVRPGTVR